MLVKTYNNVYTPYVYMYIYYGGLWAVSKIKGLTMENDILEKLEVISKEIRSTIEDHNKELTKLSEEGKKNLDRLAENANISLSLLTDKGDIEAVSEEGRNTLSITMDKLKKGILVLYNVYNDKMSVLLERADKLMA